MKTSTEGAFTGAWRASVPVKGADRMEARA
jgi:hypothetical protein